MRQSQRQKYNCEGVDATHTEGAEARFSRKRATLLTSKETQKNADYFLVLKGGQYQT